MAALLTWLGGDAAAPCAQLPPKASGKIRFFIQTLLAFPPKRTPY